MCAADIDDENLSLHARPPLSAVILTTEADRSAETLEDALGFRFCLGAGRPAFYNFERGETKQPQAGNLQIQSQILCNLLNGSGAIELRGELSRSEEHTSELQSRPH